MYKGTTIGSSGGSSSSTGIRSRSSSNSSTTGIRGRSSSNGRADISCVEFQNVFIHPTILNGDFDKIPTSLSPGMSAANLGEGEFKMVNVLIGDLSLRFTKPKATSPPLDSIILTWIPRTETRKVPISREMLVEKAHNGLPSGDPQEVDGPERPQPHAASSMNASRRSTGFPTQSKLSESLPIDIKPQEEETETLSASASSSVKIGSGFLSALKRPFKFSQDDSSQDQKEKQLSPEDIEADIISNGFTVNFKDIFGLHKGKNSGQYGGKIWIVKNSRDHTVLPPLYFLEKYTFTSFWDALQERMECKSDPQLPNLFHFSVLQDKFLISISFFKLQKFSYQTRGGTEKENPMNEDEYMALFDSEGRIGTKARNIFKTKAYFNGFKKTIRLEAWKFLLGFYPFESTFQERADIYVHRQHDYNLIKGDWKALKEEDKEKDPFLAQFEVDKYQIEKDVKRTDREDPFFEQEPRAKKLYDVLVTYDFFNRDMNYVQGMNFICAIIFKVMEGDEVFTFWCFKNIMNKCKASYSRDQTGMREQLQALSEILRILDIELYTHLERAHATEMFICYRWLLVLFRMEFTADTTIALWESMFSGYLGTPRPELFFSAAMLIHVRDELLSRPFTFDELLAFFNTYNTRDRIPCNTLVLLAEKLYKKFIQSKPRPDLLKFVQNASTIV